MNCRTLIATVALACLVLSPQEVRGADDPIAANAKPNVSAERLSGFELNAEELSRGSFSLPSIISAVPTRSLPLLDIFPRYSPDGGLTEWGLGWDNPQLRVQRRQLVGAPHFDDTDLLSTQWGMFQRSSTGRYLVQGLRSGAEASLVDGNVVVTDTDGTRYVFAERVDVKGRGTVVWYLSSIQHPAGDTLTLEYFRELDCPFLLRAYWRKSSQITLKASIIYKSVSVPWFDLSWGVIRRFSWRVNQVNLEATNRETGSLEPTKEFITTYRDSEPSQVSTVREVEHLGRLTAEHVYTYEYGDAWPVHPELPLPEPRPVLQAASLPSYEEADSVAWPSHAMHWAEDVAGFIPADFENDGITDFLRYLSYNQASWWRSAGSAFVRSQDKGPQADSLCLKPQGPQLVGVPRAGDTKPFLFEIRSDPVARFARVIECDDQATRLAEQRIEFPIQKLEQCPDSTYDPLPADGILSRKFLADVNQDGTVDLLFSDDCSIYVGLGFRYPNGGVTFGTQQADGSFRLQRIAIPGLRTDDQVSFADANGDGLVDVIAEGAAVTAWYATGQSDGFPTFTDKFPPLTISGGPGPSESCSPTLVNLDGDPSIDRIESCPKDGWIYFFRGTAGLGGKFSGFTQTRKEHFSDIATFHALAGFKPGMQLIATEPTIRASASEQCPTGTRPVVSHVWVGNTKTTRYPCTPLVRHLELTEPNVGRLKSLYDGEGHKFEFEYAYDEPRPGFGRDHVVLRAMTETVGGQDTRRQIVTYDRPAVHPKAGFFWGYGRVTIQHENVTVGTSGARTDVAFQQVGDFWVRIATQTLDVDGLLKDDVQKFTAATFRDVPWLRQDTQTMEVGSAATPPTTVMRESWTYVPNSICANEHASTRGEPRLGGASVTESFGYDEFLYDPAKLLADPYLTCHVSTLRTSSDVDDTVNVERFVRDGKGNLTHYSKKSGGKEIEVFHRVYGEDGLLTTEEVPGKPTTSFTYEQAAGGRLRLVKSDSVLTQTTSYTRDPVRDFIVQTRSEHGLLPDNTPRHSDLQQVRDAQGVGF
jgi:hypothetical protein